jgi:glycosyltransferase involved in cell wall biosynthesis
LLVKKFKLDASKIVVIPCGVNLGELKTLKKHKRDFRSILHVSSRLDNYKGAYHLIKALPKINENVILEIVGEGKERKNLELYAEKLGVLNRVKFYKYMPQKELFQKYVDADVFVLLSRCESYSMVVAEALAAGTPCIVANTSALSEWVDNETCFGVHFPIHINELVTLIERILERKIDKDKMKKWIGTKILDWDDVAKRLEDVYYENCSLVDIVFH